MLLLRRPMDEGDYLLVGLFPIRPVKQLAELIDEHTTPFGLEYAVVNDFGLILDLGESSLFSEFRAVEDILRTEGDPDGEVVYPEVTISEIGEGYSDLFEKNSDEKWFSLDKAFKADFCVFHFEDSEYFMHPDK